MLGIPVPFALVALGVSLIIAIPLFLFITPVNIEEAVPYGVKPTDGPHAWLFFIGLVGFGVFFGVSSMPEFANGLYDRSPARMYSNRIVHKTKVVGHKRSRFDRMLFLPDWRDPNKYLVIYVNDVFYANNRVGDELKIATHDGFLGYEWITSIDPYPGNYEIESQSIPGLEQRPEVIGWQCCSSNASTPGSRASP